MYFFSTSAHFEFDNILTDQIYTVHTFDIRLFSTLQAAHDCESYEGTMTNKHFGNGVSLSKKDRQQGSAFDISIDRELLRLPAMKGETII
jgi:hypothetical protein